MVLKLSKQFPADLTAVAVQHDLCGHLKKTDTF